MGGVGALMDKLPQAAIRQRALRRGAGDEDVAPPDRHHQFDDAEERRNPALIDGSRRRRIAAGAGVQVQDVNRLMKQFMEMQKMMKSCSAEDAPMRGAERAACPRAFRAGAPAGPVRRGANPYGASQASRRFPPLTHWFA